MTNQGNNLSIFQLPVSNHDQIYNTGTDKPENKSELELKLFRTTSESELEL